MSVYRGRWCGLVGGLLLLGSCGGGGAGSGPGGSSGAAGTTGSAGTTGAAGSTGEAGTTGGTGTSGAAGTSGGAGTTGSAGVAGTGNGAGGRGGMAGGGAGRGGSGGAAAKAVTWLTRTLSTQHVAEGADVGDINGDGMIDLVAGPNWYAGPAFNLGGTVIANPPTFTMNQYSTFFLTFVDDVNGDGRPDVIAIGDAGGGNGSGTPNTYWYANPGPATLGQAWTKQALFDGLVANESPAYANLLGDAKKELVFMTNRQLGYARPGATATAPWTFTAVTGSVFNTPYVHGLGVGDVDGDGMPDLLERSGWWRQVAGASWEQHTFDFGIGADKSFSNWGGSQMYTYDVDGDGDADVVTALAAHQYGLSWFEQQGTGATATFVPHAILSSAAGSNNFSQLHATQIADVNGDGLLDIITGKRYYAHPSTNPDPGTTDPAVIAWFELQRGAGGATFVQHQIHTASGVGCNFVARDLTGDGKVDIFTTNKRGTFLHVQD